MPKKYIDTVNIKNHCKKKRILIGIPCLQFLETLKCSANASANAVEMTMKAKWLEFLGLGSLSCRVRFMAIEQYSVI